MVSVFIVYDLFFYRDYPSESSIKIDQGNIRDKVIEPRDTKGKNSHNKININSADETELLSLRGIGQAKAKGIVEYRKKYGVFSSILEVKNVKGIGDKIFEWIKDSITV